MKTIINFISLFTSFLAQAAIKTVTIIGAQAPDHLGCIVMPKWGADLRVASAATRKLLKKSEVLKQGAFDGCVWPKEFIQFILDDVKRINRVSLNTCNIVHMLTSHAGQQTSLRDLVKVPFAQLVIVAGFKRSENKFMMAALNARKVSYIVADPLLSGWVGYPEELISFMEDESLDDHGPVQQVVDTPVIPAVVEPVVVVEPAVIVPPAAPEVPVAESSASKGTKGAGSLVEFAKLKVALVHVFEGSTDLARYENEVVLKAFAHLGGVFVPEDQAEAYLLEVPADIHHESQETKDLIKSIFGELYGKKRKSRMTRIFVAEATEIMKSVEQAAPVVPVAPAAPEVPVVAPVVVVDPIVPEVAVEPSVEAPEALPVDLKPSITLSVGYDDNRQSREVDEEIQNVWVYSLSSGGHRKHARGFMTTEWSKKTDLVLEAIKQGLMAIKVTNKAVVVDSDRTPTFGMYLQEMISLVPEWVKNGFVGLSGENIGFNKAWEEIVGIAKAKGLHLVPAGAPDPLTEAEIEEKAKEALRKDINKGLFDISLGGIGYEPLVKEFALKANWHLKGSKVYGQGHVNKIYAALDAVGDKLIGDQLIGLFLAAKSVGSDLIMYANLNECGVRDPSLQEVYSPSESVALLAKEIETCSKQNKYNQSIVVLSVEYANGALSCIKNQLCGTTVIDVDTNLKGMNGVKEGILQALATMGNRARVFFSIPGDEWLESQLQNLHKYSENGYKDKKGNDLSNKAFLVQANAIIKSKNIWSCWDEDLVSDIGLFEFDLDNAKHVKGVPHKPVVVKDRKDTKPTDPTPPKAPNAATPAISKPITKAVGNLYAGIGDVETPKEILDLMTLAAKAFADKGFTLRSGGAIGADVAFEKGCGTNKQIFRAKDCTEAANEAANEAAKEMTSKYHPAWDKCNDYARNLHGRNCQILLGRDVTNPEPVKFVLCWTKDGKDTGGTGQAIRIATDVGIPVYNLYYKEVVERIKTMIGLKEEKVAAPVVQSPVITAPAPSATGKPSITEAGRVVMVIDTNDGGRVAIKTYVDGKGRGAFLPSPDGSLVNSVCHELNDIQIAAKTKVVIEADTNLLEILKAGDFSKYTSICASFTIGEHEEF